MQTTPETEREAAPNPAFPIVLGLMLPWVLFLAAFTPRAWWPVSAALLGLLGVLLMVAAAYAYRRAADIGENPAKWATLAILTLGAALILLGAKRAPETSLQYLCSDCGRFGEWNEPFCYACGA